MEFSTCKVAMLPINGLEPIIDEVNFKYNQREGDAEWFDPEDFMYLFWCEQEFGSDCYMKIDVSEERIAREKDWLEECESHSTWHSSVFVEKIRIRVLEYIRARIPEDIDTVMMPLSY